MVSFRGAKLTHYLEISKCFYFFLLYFLLVMTSRIPKAVVALGMRVVVSGCHFV